MSASRVRIHYLRPPDRLTVFDQLCVQDEGDAIITFAERSGIPRTMTINGQIALEPDAPVIWFTFLGQQHDIGRFHRTDGTFTGLYANILTPVELVSRYEWNTTDLFLDLWIADGVLQRLDEAELEDALQQKWVSPEQAAAARAEAVRIEQAWQNHEWPPRIVHDWTLERVREKLAG